MQKYFDLIIFSINQEKPRDRKFRGFMGSMLQWVWFQDRLACVQIMILSLWGGKEAPISSINRYIESAQVVRFYPTKMKSRSLRMMVWRYAVDSTQQYRQKPTSKRRMKERESERETDRQTEIKTRQRRRRRQCGAGRGERCVVTRNGVFGAERAEVKKGRRRLSARGDASRSGRARAIQPPFTFDERARSLARSFPVLCDGEH